MEITSGTRLGPYEIDGRLGAGGMGEVFSARDTRLDRRVAIKVLPAEFANDVQLRLRFEREARTISQLEHPHICRLYDVGEAVLGGGADGLVGAAPPEGGAASRRIAGEDAGAPRSYLVMELLEGETLADRLARGPLPLNDVLTFGAQIADALDRAHRAGVVHRDLKPGNIMLTKSGAKLLDFGLAKGGPSAVFAPQQSVAPTEAKPLTEQGTIVGTFLYMAPEQLEGIDADARTDIFAFGTLLYEMATGRRAFEAKTRTSLIAAIVSSQPPPVSQLQPLTPPSLEHVIERCLQKDPAERWQSARDVAEELRWIAAKGSQAGVAAPVTSRRRSRERVAWSVAAVAVIAAVILGVMAIRRPAPRRVVTSINAPEGMRFTFESSTAEISPDGNALAFVAMGTDGKQMLWVRRLDSPSAQMISGTEAATFPFWAPDSRRLGFFADGKLKIVDVTGGPVERIADAAGGRGGAWGKDDIIVFAPSAGEALYRVSAAGGDVTPVTTLAGNSTSHRFPAFLRDGRSFLYYVQGLSSEEKNIHVGLVDKGAGKPLLAADSQAVYAEPGYVLWVRDGILRARRFDPKKLEFVGEAVTLADKVQASAGIGYGNISVSRTGVLCYVSGSAATASRIIVVDRQGKELAAVPAPAEYFSPRLSPDGRKIAFEMVTGGHANLYHFDIARGVTTRFTFGKTNEWGPVWSPDGEWIAYTSFEKSGGDIHIKRASGTEAERKLIADPRRKVATSFSPDGRVLFYHAISPKTNWDIEIYSFAEKRSRVFLQTPFSENQAFLSPNGRWVAYVSNESGIGEVYVRGFDAGADGGKWQVSSGGGTSPRWSADGKTLYFLAPAGKLMAVNVDESNGFAVDVPHQVLTARIRGFVGLTRNQYDISADGKTFVLNVLGGETDTPATITLVQNWVPKR